MADTLTYLQQLHIVATGQMANTSDLASLEASVNANGGYSKIDEMLNTQLSAKEASIGTVAMLQLLARQGLGLEITVEQAMKVSSDFKASGIDTWAKALHWAADNQTTLTATLDNRADAAMHFRAQVMADGNSGLFSGASIDASVGNVLQNIGASSQSLDAGKQALTMLATKLGPSGISVTIADGYIASAVIHDDANYDWWPGEDEYGTIADDNGHFLLPANVPAGRLNVTGGVDFLTHKPFKGVFMAPAGSSHVSPVTTLVQNLLDSGHSMQQATASVRAALGLSADVDVMTYEPRKILVSATATAAEKATAMAAEKAITQVGNTSLQIGLAIDAAGTNNASADRAWDVYKAMAVIVDERGSVGLKIDLTDENTLARIISISDTGGKLTGSTTGVIKIVDASNTAIAASTNVVGLAMATYVAEGDALDALINAMETHTLDATVTAYTGANLDAKIAAAHPGAFAPGVEVSVIGTTTIGTATINTTLIV